MEANSAFSVVSDGSPGADPSPPAGQEFDHSTRLALVDKKGEIRGFYDGYPGKHDEGAKGYEDGLKVLKASVAELLKE